MKKMLNISEIEKAVVRLPERGGLGVLSTGGIIITAAHCVKFSAEGDMAYNKKFLQKVNTYLGEFYCSTLAVELVADIAVLGPADGQELPRDLASFEEFCNKTKPIHLSFGNFIPKVQVNGWSFNQDSKFVSLQLKLARPYAEKLSMKTEGVIKGGDSGGPVVSEDGKLIGVISHIELHRNDGLVPILALTLPVWIIEQIRREATEEY